MRFLPLPRRAHTLLMVVGVTALLGLTGCGDPSRPASAGELLTTYRDSTTVVNDIVSPPPQGRAISLAAALSGENLASLLEGSYRCGDRPRVVSAVGIASKGDPGCPVPPAVRIVGQATVRLPLVRHADGTLELVPLYAGSDGAQLRLFDVSGASYSGLDDFQRRNEILGRDDQMLVAADPLAALDNSRGPAGTGIPDPAHDRLIVVPGSTAPLFWPYYVGLGVGIPLIVLVLALVVLRLSRARRER